ncbi:AraC family transcriptional regulator [Paraburkholderia gardini]|uniref:HTH araC/xylS-type domain-containing protein n=1 Tax=Paraburkholderia gardini TaxID=2823469 RepID=A0ABM8UAA1_9BURK|nr:AraC family transcriptional regulator [Paraburkholderia gardini]CAG4922449.1 hypothetical protein R54767_04895 [Paraburkholderia gardini]
MQRGRVQMVRCAIDGLEATVAETTHAFPRHSHDGFGIGVIVRGGQRSASGRGPVEALANDVITCNPGEVHDGSPLDARGRAWHMFYFAPALMFEAAGELTQTFTRDVELTQPVTHDPLLKIRFERLFAAAVDDAASPCDMAREEALVALLAHVGAHHTMLTPPRLAAAPIARAKVRIDDDPASALTLADLASEAGMSRFQLLRGFARELGLPPHAYRMQRRVALARRLIATGSALADAAAGAGFADQSHMTRAFVRLLGVTPASYAAAMRRS